MITGLLAGACNAVMDKVDHHFGLSVFDLIKNKSKRVWWNESEGWRNKYIERDYQKGRVKWRVLGFEFNKPEVFTDAWHHFKFWMIFNMALSAIELALLYVLSSCVIWHLALLCFCTFSIGWIIAFNTFYNKLLTKKFWGK
jgi:hypothetical protein